jgi:hypothetical protein
MVSLNHLDRRERSLVELISTVRLSGYLPLPKSFKAADRLIKYFLGTKRKLTQNIGDNEEIWNDLWDVVRGQGPIWETSRVLNALPENQTSFTSDFFLKGGSGKQHTPRSIRDISWLEEHGQCMDNIKVDQSENPDAGRGAFANRFIPEGGLVAPAPLIHIGSYDFLKMFQPIDDKTNEGVFLTNMNGPMMYQLLMVRFWYF